MQKELEIEIKSLLSQNQFNYIKNQYFDNVHPLIQTNTYFDTPSNALKTHRMALRIRQTDADAVLTLKSKQDQLSSFEYSLPFHQTLEQTLATSPTLSQKIPAEIHELLPIVTFTTHRYTLQDAFGLICLDLTYYEDEQCDFEIEIELLSQQNLTDALAWLKKHRITYHQAAPKIARALAQQADKA